MKGVRSILNLTPDTPQALVWTPRAALRLGMLLRDSAIAKAVRTSLLDVVERVLPALTATYEAPALTSPDRFTLLKEAVEIDNQLGGFDDR
ncbi:hypothetical protein H6F90_12155 [Trichocoleus sp. FACHB-591]|uniref:hypothetical protein n=1 Tax=Trichocoleus sp. FACHB-591 TaxID=2692872 RepID=UPI00168420F5|nr:hypothetical protein [Trichocoleus sp. FACHB-591]MBD2095900.1 hypothetical protein [Trichocoleus sp. FACHB-591]